jgi:hypothetical protein
MLIISNPYGRLCNRLFLFSHFIANSIEYGYTLINPTFNEYKHYFDSTRLNNFKSSKIFLSKYFINLYINIIQNNIKTKFKKSRLHAIYYLNSSNDEFFDLNNKEFVNEVIHKIVFINGWLFRDNTILIIIFWVISFQRLSYKLLF